MQPSNCPGGDKDGLVFSFTQSPLSPLVQFGNNFSELTLQTSDPNDFGTLTIELTIAPASGELNIPPYTV